MTEKENSVKLAKLKDLYYYGLKLLDNFTIEDKQLKIELLLRYYLNLTKEKFYIYLVDNKIFNLDFKRYNKDLILLSKDFPIEYIIKYKYFYGLKFYVNENVLIPRFDSEILIDKVLAYIKSKSLKKVNILDIGTGSGCLIISILKNCDFCYGEGVDISDKALSLTYLNANKFKVLNRLKIYRSDLFSNVNKKFDIIIANFPYVKSRDLIKNKYEPLIALDGKEDGLFFYKRFKKRFLNYLKINACVFLELGYDLKDEIIYLFKEFDIKLFKDLNNIDRVIKICL